MSSRARILPALSGLFLLAGLGHAGAPVTMAKALMGDDAPPSGQEKVPADAAALPEVASAPEATAKAADPVVLKRQRLSAMAAAMPPGKAARLLTAAGPGEAAEVLASLPPEKAAEIISSMDDDEAAGVVRAMVGEPSAGGAP